ncbi:SRPBCC family protein [Nocardia cyriacigeorgica]|uniref:SRPBCC family protein n=1 Tax=Nocardia cyriacigeorgica TaxID=135487 RepID=UPI00245455C8|nr:SRPBCC family protein [Nocardia cyriacigeorgica]
MNTGLVWGATEAERAAALPCDELEPNALSADRAISIDASPALVFAWLCQLRVATYSFRLGNRGKPSPRVRDPRLTELAVGQRFMGQFELEAFEPGRHVTLRADDICVTYAVHPEGAGTRLVVRVRFGGPRWVGRIFAVGDVIMMRKQLRTLKELAEAEESS